MPLLYVIYLGREHSALPRYTEFKDGFHRMAQPRRSFLFSLSTIAVFAVLGGVYGPRVEVASAASDEDSIRTSEKTFTKVYELVEQNFADPVDPDKAIYKGAIPGMLRTLDPHSNFFDPHDFQLLREDQKGHYYGVGMTVQPRNGKTIVMAPFKGSPAYKAGIRPGDVITEVNDKPTDNLDHHRSRRPAERPARHAGPDHGASRGGHPRADRVQRHPRRDQPQERPGCALGQAGHRLRG